MITGLLVEGDGKLFDQYGVILVNPAMHPTVNVKEGQAFVDWPPGPRDKPQSPATKLTASSSFSQTDIRATTPT